MVEWVRQSLSGWGHYPVVETDVARAESREGAIRLAREGRDADAGGVLAHGLGRSYGDTALLAGGHVILTRRLDRLLDFDPATGWLHCESGVSYEDLLRVFVPRGFFPPVTPGTQFVTMGGALGCDVHGKNHHRDGSFSTHVRAFELLLSSGDVVRVTRETHPELFRATVGGMGLTGIVLSLELKLTPIANPWIEMESIRVENLDHFFEVSRESQGQTHTVSWIDCTTRGAAMGRGIFMRGHHAAAGVEGGSPGFLSRVKDAAPAALDVPLDAPGWLLNHATVRAFNEVYFRKHPKGLKKSVQHYEPFFYPLDAVRRWNRIYGRRGFLQYQLVVPPDPDHRALRAALEAVTASGFASFLAVIKEFGPEDHGFLSFPRPGVTLALDFANHGAPLLDLFERLDAIVMEAGGRVYLGKDARLGRAAFQSMYPEWAAWKAIRDEYDPTGTWRSALGLRLGLIDPTTTKKGA